MASSTTTNHAAAWLFVGAILVGGVTAAYLYTREPDPSASGEVAAIAQDSAAGSETTTAPDSGDKAASQEITESPAEKSADSGEATPPSFDVLRVEQDGSAVVAGTAPQGSMVVLLANGEEIATGTAGAGGDFAIVLDEPLGKGDYELTLQAKDSSGLMIMSNETGVVSVPEEGGELLAMVTEDGKASRVMQAPAGDAEQSETAAIQTPAADAPATEAPAAEMQAEEKSADEKAMETAKLDQGSEAAMTKEAAPAEEKQAEQPTQAQEPNIAPVLVQAVDVDGGSMYIAGSGAPNRDVNIYLDDDYLGTTKVTAGGTFLLEAAKALDSGNYTIRADMLDEKGATVARRASVELQHQIDTQTALQAAPAEEKTPGIMEKAEAELEAVEDKAVEMAKAATDAVEKEAAEVVETAKAETEAVEEKAAEVMATAKTEVETAEEKAVEMAKAATEAVENEAAAVMDTAKTATEAVEEKAADAMETAKSEVEVVEDKAAEVMEEAKVEAEVVEEKAEEMAAEVMEAAEAEAEAVEEKAAGAMEMAKAEAEAVEGKAGEVMETAKTEMEAVEENAVAAVENSATGSEQATSQEAASLAERMEPKSSDDDTAAMAKTDNQAQNTEKTASAQQPQAPVIQSGASVIIRRGDNLWRISRRMLGKGVQYTVIFDANRDQIEDPDLIFPGQVFDVPGATAEDQG